MFQRISIDLLSSIDIQLLLSVIYDVSQSRALPVKPALAKRLINIEWLNVSKAADRSRKTIIVPISLARISLLILTRAVYVLLLGT